MRTNVRSLGQLAFALGLLALLALIAASLVMRSALAARDAEAALQRNGVVMTMTVTHVTDTSRTGVPLEAQVRLPDGRTTVVDVSQSAARLDLRSGSKIDVLVQADDISNNRPEDAATSRGQLRAAAGPLIALGIGAAIMCAIVYRLARRQGPDATARGKTIGSE
ncbi:hypothetical protein [Kribbella sp. NBC_00889]|uniref:hypothetical protein n=1 Tax=Kribbella sp. NBC_00889 TaxID=2975974 RepID=UPI00386ABC20|nr:hypothetical protein OG817_13220 [Kribbella sp. NBC_00889]